jgi:hypothetical protein
LTVPDIHAFVLSKLLIVFMGFPRLGAGFYTEIAHEYTYSHLSDVRHER